MIDGLVFSAPFAAQDALPYFSGETVPTGSLASKALVIRDSLISSRGTISLRGLAIPFFLLSRFDASSPGLDYRMPSRLHSTHHAEPISTHAAESQSQAKSCKTLALIESVITIPLCWNLEFTAKREELHRDR
jgi:hypothetical protein